MCMLIEGFNCAVVYNKEGKQISGYLFVFTWLKIPSAPNAECGNVTPVLPLKISKMNVCNNCTVCKVQRIFGL